MCVQGILNALKFVPRHIKKKNSCFLTVCKTLAILQKNCKSVHAGTGEEWAIYTKDKLL